MKNGKVLSSTRLRGFESQTLNLRDLRDRVRINYQNEVRKRMTRTYKPIKGPVSKLPFNPLVLEQLPFDFVRGSQEYQKASDPFQFPEWPPLSSSDSDPDTHSQLDDHDHLNLASFASLDVPECGAQAISTYYAVPSKTVARIQHDTGDGFRGVTLLGLYALSLSVAHRFSIKEKDAVLYFDMADITELLAELFQAKLGPYDSTQKSLPTCAYTATKQSPHMSKMWAMGGVRKAPPFWTHLYFLEDNGY